MFTVIPPLAHAVGLHELAPPEQEGASVTK